VLVPQIIKFLFQLTKQKDHKVITIPKIINLTDTILANSSIRQCAMLTLCELAFNIFFDYQLPEPIAEANANQHERDMNTQKEVVISMMMKFLDDNEVRMMMIMITRKKKGKRRKYGSKMNIFFLCRCLRIISKKNM
jgi:hypothetical protein